MGYYTEFDIEVYNSNGKTVQNIDTLKQMAKDLNRVSDNYFGPFEGTIQDLLGCENYKWYTHEEDMLELSRLYPNNQFTLWGWGEDRLDFWIEHYKNGRCIRRMGRIAYEDWKPDEIDWKENK